jgi:hypothetical protein
MAYHEYFEQELIDLRKEIANHPDLMTILAVQSDTDIYVHIAEIAAYCQMVLDGTYSKEDVLKLCTIMTERLRNRRAIIVQPFIGD